MLSFDINYWAVLVSGIAAMVVGFLWYGPIFGKQWMSLMGFTKESSEAAKKKGMGKLYASQFVLALVEFSVLSVLMANLGVVDAWGGLKMAFSIWLGFVMPVQGGAAIFSNKTSSWKLFLIDTGNHLVTLLVAGAVLGGWM